MESMMAFMVFIRVRNTVHVDTQHGGVLRRMVAYGDISRDRAVDGKYHAALVVGHLGIPIKFIQRYPLANLSEAPNMTVDIVSNTIQLLLQIGAFSKNQHAPILFYYSVV